nr:unnamed protein product [Callosobruchus analis]
MKGQRKFKLLPIPKKIKVQTTTQLLRSMRTNTTCQKPDANTTKDKVEEKTDDLDFKVEVVSEKFLKHNIAYVSDILLYLYCILMHLFYRLNTSKSLRIFTKVLIYLLFSCMTYYPLFLNSISVIGVVVYD